MAALALLEVLAEVPDPRSRHGRRHPLPALLALVVLAMLRGCQGPVAIAQFGRDYGTPLAHALGFTRGKTPAASCLCRLLWRRGRGRLRGRPGPLGSVANAAGRRPGGRGQGPGQRALLPRRQDLARQP